VIRRHPDIKLLRRREDIDALVSLQTRLLDSTWQTLKRGGRLLYATCSVLPQENHQQIEAFLARTPDAKLLDLTLPNQASSNANLGAFENPAKYGLQLFPQAGSHDGFYYALLVKK
jgi:16S rRNA (cytosine967-C5)-methyltransferase